MGSSTIVSPITIANNRIDVGNIKPPFDGAQILVYDSAVNSTVVLYTVPSGKVFLVYAIIAAFKNNSGTAASPGYLEIVTDTGLKVLNIGAVTMNDNNGNIATFQPTIPIQISEGYKVRLHSNSATRTVYGSLFGIETQGYS